MKRFVHRYTPCDSRARGPGSLRFPLVLAALLAGCREEGSFPERPIVLICPWSAGGGTDTVSRKVAELLERDLGVPVNVINATGGSGVTGHTRGALARPDGHTMTMITVELNMLHWRGLTNIDPTDFEPVMMLNRDDAALFVRDDAPWQSLSELQAAIASEPRALAASGTAQGGIWHVSLAGWLDSVGLKADDVIWISINGAGPSLNELMAGGVDMVCCSLPEAASLLESGRVRCLGVMADDRVPGFPDVPTFREQGVDWSMGGWRGLAVPVGVPPDRVEVLVDAVGRVVQSDEYRDFMARTGFNVSIEPPNEFRETMMEVDQRMGEILTGEAFQSVRKSRYGPMTFPAVVVILLVLTFSILVLRGDLQLPDDVPPITRAGMARMGLAIGFVVVYLVISDTVGYVLTAGVLLAVFLGALRVRWPVALGVPAVLVPMTYQIFAVGLRVPLPWGWLGW